MKVKDLPLRNLFEKLRSVGFVLGVDDYDLLLRALMGGFGVSATEPEAALKQLCETLWVKSEGDRPLFNRCFDDCISESRPESRVITPSPVEPSDISEPIPSPTPSESPDVESTSSEPTPSELADLESTPSESTPLDFPSDVTLEMPDEVRVKKTKERELEEKAGALFRFRDYLPVSEREMKQTWRYLRRPLREGAATELDVEQTVVQVAQRGFLLDPVLVAPRVNRVELTLLLDVDGSMVAFHRLGERLQSTAIGGGRLGRSHLYYFHNCPLDFLYHDRTLTDYSPLDQVLRGLSPRHGAVVIFSDGGAARGGDSEERLEMTAVFLERLRSRVDSVVWVNPMPPERWQGMVGCDRRGLQRAMKILKGRSLVEAMQ